MVMESSTLCKDAKQEHKEKCSNPSLSKLTQATNSMEELQRKNNGGGQPMTSRSRSNGFLMHAKYMHDLCSLLMHIPTYYNVISSYNHVL
jgi:hypothetical protein